MNAPKIPMTTRVHDVLKQATHRMSKKQILAQIPIVTSQESVAAALNALRTEKLVDSALGGDIKKPRELVYWAVMPKEAEIKEQARNLTQEIISVVKAHGNGGYMTATDIAEYISPRVSPRTISQRLSSMAPRHLERKNIEGGKTGPAGRTYVAHYRLPVAQQEAPAQGESDAKASPALPDGGAVVDAEFFPEANGKSDHEVTDINSPCGWPHGDLASIVNDIRHVCSAEGIQLDLLAQHLRLERGQLLIRDKALKEVESALAAAGIDLTNQSPKEGVDALAGAVKALKMANVISTQSAAATAPLILTETACLKSMRAVADLQAMLSATGASLTITEGDTSVEVVFGNGAESRAAHPGNELLQLCDALRVLKAIPQPSKLAA